MLVPDPPAAAGAAPATGNRRFEPAARRHDDPPLPRRDHPRGPEALPLRGLRVRKHPQGPCPGPPALRAGLPRHLRGRDVEPGLPAPLPRAQRPSRRGLRAGLPPLAGHGGHAPGEPAPALHAGVARPGPRPRRRRGDAPVRAGLHEHAGPARPLRHPAPHPRPRRSRSGGHRRWPVRLQPRAGRRLLRRPGGGGRRGRRPRDRRRRAGLEGQRRGPGRAAPAALARARSLRPVALRAPLRPRHRRAARHGRARARLRDGGPSRRPRHRHPLHLGLRATRRPVHADRARPAAHRAAARLHAGLPLLPGGHDHPAHPAAQPGDGPARGRAGAPGLRLRGGRAALALLRRLRQPESAPRRLPLPVRVGAGVALAPVAAHRDHERRAGREDRPRPQDRLHARARGGHRAHARGDQQGKPRGGPARRASSRSSRTAGRCSSSTS